MNFLRKCLLSWIMVLCLIDVIKCAPTPIDETATSIDPCESEDMLICDVDDEECNRINSERIVKTHSICSKNPHCKFCDLFTSNGNTLEVVPEIVPTISPPLKPEHEMIPVNETIIIDAEIISITESQRSDQKEREMGKLIERNIVIENDNETQYYRGYVDPSSNITTIIRLTNLINNTNVINMPTTLNNTNINNIHVYSNKSSVNGGKFGLGYTEDGPCCWSMKPGTCKSTTAGLKCSHKKVKVCGRKCNKKMIHPNRNQSPCIQIQQWPYVMCPPAQNPPYMQYPFYPQYMPPSYEQFEDEFDDDDDLPLFPEDEELDNNDLEWIVMQEKCKIVSEDGLHITNCTDSNMEFGDHPYAKNSLSNQPKRTARHVEKFSGNIQFPSQHKISDMRGYPIFQPVFYQPIPMIIPQYFVPQPVMSTYPQQLPFPPLENDHYYSEPAIEPKGNNPYRKSRKHAKKNPIISADHEDEL